MPEYSDHLIFNLIALSVIFLLYQYLKPDISILNQIAFIIFFILGTAVLTPDLDSPKSIPSKKCGALCKPYTMMSKHRGASHGVFSGVFLRIVYILLILFFIIWIVFGFPEIKTFVMLILGYKIAVVFAVLGLFVSNLLHIALDVIT